MYKEYYPKKKVGLTKIMIIVVSAITLLIIIAASVLLFPKVAGYLERKQIEQENIETMEEIKELTENTEEVEAPEVEGVKIATSPTIERVREETSLSLKFEPTFSIFSQFHLNESQSHHTQRPKICINTACPKTSKSRMTLSLLLIFDF